MRGVEAAIAIWGETRRGIFLSQALRRFGEDLVEGERQLASTLVYSGMRRYSLWVDIVKSFLHRPLESLVPITKDILILGCAGLLEIKHFFPQALVNAFVEVAKKKRPTDAALVNAVLRRIASEGKLRIEKLKDSPNLFDQALLWGLPHWIARRWAESWGMELTKKLLIAQIIKPYLSFRLSPKASIDEMSSQLSKRGIKNWKSPYFSYVLRSLSFGHPPSIIGYSEGSWTPQTESSIFVSEKVVSLSAGKRRVLDMCAGRGIKTGHILEKTQNTIIEAWDISKKKVYTGQRELERLGVLERSVWKAGNSLELVPDEAPDVVLLDAPCSGSGAWSRHPEGKWKLSASKLRSYSRLQRDLLRRAVDLVAAEGIVVYSTCSMFREENEATVGKVLCSTPDIIEIEIDGGDFPLQRGRPFGYYTWPSSPWVDGFFLCVLMKR
ncbi:MAG: RsmB/NOP family class I SAM-dependent RNA methyltransferase [Acetomicrobium sp.]